MSAKFISTLLACIAFGIGMHASSSTQAHGRHSSQVPAQLPTRVVRALLRSLGYDPEVHCTGLQPVSPTDPSQCPSSTDGTGTSTSAEPTDATDTSASTEPTDGTDTSASTEPTDCTDTSTCPICPTCPDPTEPDQVAIFRGHKVWHGEGITYRICNYQKKDIEITISTRNELDEPQGNTSMIVPARQGRNATLTFVVDGGRQNNLASISSRVEIRHLETGTESKFKFPEETYCQPADFEPMPTDAILITRAHHSPYFTGEEHQDRVSGGTKYKSEIACFTDTPCDKEDTGAGTADKGPHTH